MWISPKRAHTYNKRLPNVTSRAISHLSESLGRGEGRSVQYYTLPISVTPP